MATKLDEDRLAGNDEDSLNPGNNWYSPGKPLNEEESAKLAALEKDATSDDDQDGLNSDSDPETTRRALQRGDQSPNAVPSTTSAPGASTAGKLDSKLGSGSKRNVGATGGIIGALIALAFGGGMFAGFNNVLTYFSNLGASHFDLGKHLFVKSTNSYMASLFLGESRSCAESKIKCKLTTISERQVKNWESRNIEVIKDKSLIPGRWKVRGLKFPNGTEVKSLADWRALRYNDPVSYSLTKWFPVRAWINEKGSFMTSKASAWFKGKFTADKSANASERKAKSNEAIDKETGAVTGDTQEARVKSIGDKVRSSSAYTAADKYMKKITDVTGSAKFNVALAALLMGCDAYNLVRAVSAAMQAYWYEQLGTFLAPFLQAGSQIMQNGSIDWQTAEYLGGRMNATVTQEMVDSDESGLYTQDMVGKSAMDADGIFAMLNGDTKTLDGYAADYTAWSPVSHVKGAGVMDQLNSFMQDYIPGGKTTLKATCQTARAASWVAAATCVAQGPACLAQAGLVILLQKMFGDDIEEWLIKKMEQPAFEAIAKANLTSSLTGPPLGQALVGAYGMVAESKDRAAGFQIAGSKEDMLAMYDSLHDDIVQDEIAAAKSRTLQDQFNIGDQGSFANQVLTKIAAIPQGNTGAGFLASLGGVLSQGVGAIADMTTTHAYRDGLLQPISTFSSDKTLSKAISNCTDPFKDDINVPCLGSSGQTVPYFSPEVMKCMEDEGQNADPDQRCIEKAVDYLAKIKYDKDKTLIDKDSGAPTDFSEYSEDDAGKAYDNPFLMYMENCGRTRVYEPGYTDKEFDDSNIAWYEAAMCANKDDQGNDIPAANNTKNKGWDKKTLGWMSYYYNECIAVYASEEGTDYCWDDEPAAAPTETKTEKGTVALDPGHSIQDIHDIEPTTGAELYDYPNGKEVYDAWDIATKVKARLEQDGYTVKMLRSSIDERVNFQERADRAKGSAMAVSIHTTPSGGSQVGAQTVGGQRYVNDKTMTFENQATASKSSQCANAMAKARSGKEGGGVDVRGFNFAGRAPIAEGNLPWVQLLSPDTPWVYNEMQPSDGGGGANGISEASKSKYIEGLVAGIEACDIPKGDTPGVGASVGAVSMNIQDTPATSPLLSLFGSLFGNTTSSTAQKSKQQPFANFFSNLNFNMFGSAQQATASNSPRFPEYTFATLPYWKNEGHE